MKHLIIRTDDPGAAFEPELLNSVSETAKIETLYLTQCDIGTADSKDHFIKFLLAHRATLRHLRLEMCVSSEQWLWEIVDTLYRKLTLESCKLQVEAYRGAASEFLMPQLRDIIRRFGGPGLAIKKDESIKLEHGVALDRYILGQPALGE